MVKTLKCNNSGLVLNIISPASYLRRVKLISEYDQLIITKACPTSGHFPPGILKPTLKSDQEEKVLPQMDFGQEAPYSMGS